MSAPGSALSRPDQVAAAQLMALEHVALRVGQDPSGLAERPGTTPTRRRGQGHEIREIRPWSEGDEPRHMDAAASARIGSPQTRSFQEDRESSLFLIADFRRPMLWGTQTRLRSVAAAEALAVAGWHAIHAGGAVGVTALTDNGPDVQIPRPRHRGMTLVSACMARAHDAALAQAASDPSGRQPVRPLAPDLIRAARQVPRGAGIILATGLDDIGDGFDAALAALSARGPVQILLIEDAFELTPPGHTLTFAQTRSAKDGSPAPDTARQSGSVLTAQADFMQLPRLRDERPDLLTRAGLSVRRIASSLQEKA